MGSEKGICTRKFIFIHFVFIPITSSDLFAALKSDNRDYLIDNLRFIASDLF